MKLCEESHDLICYDGRSCPLCEAIQNLDNAESNIDELKEEKQMAYDKIDELKHMVEDLNDENNNLKEEIRDLRRG